MLECPFNKVAGLLILRWLLLQMFCFTFYFQKDVAEWLNIVSFWNLKSLSFAFIRFHPMCHSLPFVVSLVVICCHSLSLVVIRCTNRCYSLSFVVTCCTTRCDSMYHVPLVCLFINDYLNKANKGQNTRNISSPPAERNNRLSDRKWLIVWRFCQNRENYKTNSFFFFYQRSWKINNCYQQCIGYFRFTWIQ